LQSLLRLAWTSPAAGAMIAVLIRLAWTTPAGTQGRHAAGIRITAAVVAVEAARPVVAMGVAVTVIVGGRTLRAHHAQVERAQPSALLSQVKIATAVVGVREGAVTRATVAGALVEPRERVAGAAAVRHAGTGAE